MRETDNNDPSTSRIERIIHDIEARKRQDPTPEAQRIVALEKVVDDHETRIRENTERLGEGDVKLATLALTNKTMQRSLDKISSTLSKLNWIIIAAVVMALLHLVLRMKGAP
jgi:hypothetical protein